MRRAGAGQSEVPVAVAGGSLALLALLAVYVVGGPIKTPDFWFHAKMGEAYLAEGPWLEVDPLLHTVEGQVAAEASPEAPQSNSAPSSSASGRTRGRSSSRAREISRGRCRRACSSSSRTLRPAASASTSRCSGWRSTTSRVERPTEPVDPRMVRRQVMVHPVAGGGTAQPTMRKM